MRIWERIRLPHLEMEAWHEWAKEQLFGRVQCLTGKDCDIFLKDRCGPVKRSVYEFQKNRRQNRNGQNSRDKTAGPQRVITAQASSYEDKSRKGIDHPMVQICTIGAA